MKNFLLFILLSLMGAVASSAQCTTATPSILAPGAYLFTVNHGLPVSWPERNEYIADSTVWLANGQPVPSIPGCDCWQNYHYYAPSIFSDGICSDTTNQGGCLRTVLISDPVQINGGWYGMLLWNSNEPYTSTTPGALLAGGVYGIPINTTIGADTVVVVDTVSGCSQTLVFLPEFRINIIRTTTCNSSTLVAVPYFPNLYSGVTYLWSNGTTNDTLNAIPGTAYLLTATTAAGQTAVVSTFADSYSMSSSISASNVMYCSTPSRFINLNISGQTYGAQYTWSNGATTQDITIYNPGTYSVTVTNNYGCTTTATKTVASYNDLYITSLPNRVAACGDTSATTSIGVNGGIIGSYTYLWSNGTTTASTILTDPVTSVTVSSGGWCTVTGSATLTVPSIPSVQISVDNDTICQNGTTQLHAITNDNVWGYTWSHGYYQANVPVYGYNMPQPQQNYGVTISTQYGCTASASTTVWKSNPVTTTTPVQSICPGNMALIDATVSGGYPGYTYMWNNGDTTSSIDVPPGNYTVTVTDMIGCTTTATTDVYLSSPVGNTSISGPAITVCGGGSITLTANPGGGNYTYLWSNGTTTRNVTANVLSDTTFTVTITRNNGCTATATRTITMATIPTLAITSDTADCSGYGTIATQITGGTAPYSFNWSNGTTNQNLTAVPGNYLVTVTSAQGCTATTNGLIQAIPTTTDTIHSVGYQNLSIVEPLGSITSISITSTIQNCERIDIATTVTIDSTKESKALVITDTTNVIQTSICVSDTLINLVTYDTIITSSVVKYDTMTTTAIDTVYLTPNIIQINVSDNTITVTGATNYLWSNGDTGSVIMVPPGTYTVTATDLNGCTSTASATVVPTGVTTISSKEVALFPNPTTDNVTIELPNTNFMFSVWNSIGQIVVQPTEAVNSATVNLGNQTPGVYFILVERPDGSKTTTPVIKQ
jgi:hypothetical protein